MCLITASAMDHWRPCLGTHIHKWMVSDLRRLFLLNDLNEEKEEEPRRKVRYCGFQGFHRAFSPPWVPPFSRWTVLFFSGKISRISAAASRIARGGEPVRDGRKVGRACRILRRRVNLLIRSGTYLTHNYA